VQLRTSYSQLTMPMLAVARTILLCLSVFMVWEAVSPTTFTAIVRPPIRGWLETSYLATIAGSIMFLGMAISAIVRRPYIVAKNVFHLFVRTLVVLDPRAVLFVYGHPNGPIDNFGVIATREHFPRMWGCQKLGSTGSTLHRLKRRM
jgi:hypothetical protein